MAAPVKDVLVALAEDLGLLTPRVPMKEDLKGDDEGELMIGRIRHDFPGLEWLSDLDSIQEGGCND